MSGLVCSTHEVGKIHAIHGDAFADNGLRQVDRKREIKRVMTPSEAARVGSDFIVVGRLSIKRPIPKKSSVAFATNCLCRDASELRSQVPERHRS